MKTSLPWRPRLAIAQLVAILAFVNLVLPLLAQSAGAAGDAPLIRIVAYGDSLTAGYGLPRSATFSVQLAKALEGRNLKVEVVNAGVSGDTTAAGLERFDWAVPEKTDVVILELGANDALRGMDPRQARANLEAIITKLKARGIDVLLAGMAAPRSLGEAYVAEFDRIYPELASKHGVSLYPFFLDGVATHHELNLDDGLHPNAKGIVIIVERMLPKIVELINRRYVGTFGFPTKY